MNDIYVFLGPTLAEKDARAELDAVYLPPVAAGDVYRLWRRRPRAVGIVDGYFDRVPAVWHKEILWIMERGVHVFGAAGLGALRAAELDRFGMHGVGWVYQAFRDETLDRDDEVARGPGSEAMVNIRRTLAVAEQQGIISAVTAAVLLTAGTDLFYPERTWPALLQAAGATRGDAAELDALRRWLPDGRVDQQAADAVDMLREMRGLLAADPAPQQVSWSMAPTAMWEAAKRRADTLSRDGAAGSRPMLEPILDEIRLAGPGAYEAACCRSLLRVFAADFAEREGVTIDGERLHDAVAAFRMSRNLEQSTELTRFLADNDLSAEEFDRLIVTGEMVRWACGQAEWAAFGDLLDDLRLNGEYAQLVARARAKLDDDGPPGTAAEALAALEWYFAQRRGTAVPDDLADYAQSCGFPDEQAFRTAVRREYEYAYRRPQLRGDVP
jgi:AraC-like DNA-binding protein